MRCFAIVSVKTDMTGDMYAHEYDSVPMSAIYYRDARIGNYPWRDAKSGQFIRVLNVRIC